MNPPAGILRYPVKYPVWLKDADLIAALKARAVADSRTVTAVAALALSEYLERPVRLDEPAVSRSRTGGASRAARVLADVATPALCRTCRHADAKHYGTEKSPQLKCNVMGCSCPRLRVTEDANEAG